VKKAMGAGIPIPNWIARMVGKVTEKLEAAKEDIGYSSEIPIRLDKSRPKHPESVAKAVIVVCRC
jgi:hypothetical protein